MTIDHPAVRSEHATTKAKGRYSANCATPDEQIFKPKISTKIDRIVEALKQPCGLNRFDAERIGDHALNSTVAIVRKRHGDSLRQEWETVPTRFNPAGVRVYRYWLVEGAQ